MQSSAPSSSSGVAPLDAGALRSVSIDLFGRPPTPEERERWIGAPRGQFVTHALGTEEAWRHWLDEQLYYFMLLDRFRPVGTTLDELPALLARRAATPQYALHRIGLCPNFSDRNPGADTFVTVVMEQYCGIEVQKAKAELELGKRAFEGKVARFLGKKARSQADVLSIAAGHPQAARHFVAREHERLTGRVLPKRERNRAAKRLADEPRAAFGLYAQWLASSAYGERIASGRPVRNQTWIRMVHHDLGRGEPEADELEALRGALDGLGDPAPLRSAIVRMALAADDVAVELPTNAAEARPFVRAQFESLLGRSPSPDEASAFVPAAATREGARAVLYVLMTSEEYERP